MESPLTATKGTDTLLVEAQNEDIITIGDVDYVQFTADGEAVVDNLGNAVVMNPENVICLLVGGVPETTNYDVIDEEPEPTEPTTPTEPTEPTEPTTPTEPEPTVDSIVMDNTYLTNTYINSSDNTPRGVFVNMFGDGPRYVEYDNVDYDIYINYENGTGAVELDGATYYPLLAYNSGNYKYCYDSSAGNPQIFGLFDDTTYPNEPEVRYYTYNGTDTMTYCGALSQILEKWELDPDTTEELDVSNLTFGSYNTGSIGYDGAVYSDLDATDPIQKSISDSPYDLVVGDNTSEHYDFPSVTISGEVYYPLLWMYDDGNTVEWLYSANSSTGHRLYVKYSNDYSVAYVYDQINAYTMVRTTYSGNNITLMGYTEPEPDDDDDADMDADSDSDDEP